MRCGGSQAWSSIAGVVGMEVVVGMAVVGGQLAWVTTTTTTTTTTTITITTKPSTPHNLLPPTPVLGLAQWENQCLPITNLRNNGLFN